MSNESYYYREHKIGYIWNHKKGVIASPKGVPARRSALRHAGVAIRRSRCEGVSPWQSHEFPRFARDKALSLSLLAMTCWGKCKLSCAPLNKCLRIELTCITKSPLAPLCQRGVLFLPLASFSCCRQAKGGEEGFYKTMSPLF